MLFRSGRWLAPAALAGTYPDAASQRPITQIIEAAGVVAELNLAYLSERGQAPVTAAFTDDTTTLVDPIGGNRELYRR